ncbi:MAG TPA: hypothetical protein VN176_09240 [Verrucomicrobiae bacterium]|jgi:ABC-type phosphate transport system substrate-binding protein|nr:hypothetical protein [Verrucomicrobiae bacterium]
MKKYRGLGLFVFVVSALAPCYAHHLAVVVNQENTVQSVSSADLAKMFKGESKRWPDGLDVVIVLQGANGEITKGEMDTLLRLNKMTDAQLRALLADHKNSIVIVASDAAVLKQVQSTKGAIGLVDVRSITGKIKVLKVDGRLPLEHGYLPH